jgi:hypothetical protein
LQQLITNSPEINEDTENLSKENYIYIKKKQMEIRKLKITIIEIINSTDGFDSQLLMTEDRISEPEGILIEFTQSEQEREN